jgi:hypothetical protein
VAEYERHGDYPSYERPEVIELAELGDLPSRARPADVVLVCAVLHHEPDPALLLDQVRCAFGASRWLVFENPLTDRWSHDSHDMFDWFFNSVLNEFGVATPGNHRSNAGWVDLLQNYGVVDAAIEFDLPGIPFPYTFFDVSVTQPERP